MNKTLWLFALTSTLFVSAFAQNVGYLPGAELKLMDLQNQTANIPPMCYTKTKDENGKIHNPCYACHIKGEPPNFIDDSNLQKQYAFPKYALKNRWGNLFKDKTSQVSKISDSSVLDYIRQDNYKDKSGQIIISGKLKNLPFEWDFYNDKKWRGYIPDAYFNFDNEGFDKDQKGAYTGWRAFAYYPFLGTFWPTNGSTDDVLIRLPEQFRKNEKGVFDKEVYKLNLAILESLIKQKDVAIEPTDKSKYGVDLDSKGKTGVAKIVKYRYKLGNNDSMSYVGMAKILQAKGEVYLGGGVYPEGTEFLHSVRYIDVNNSKIAMAPRMKELRYAVKTRRFMERDMLMFASFKTSQQTKFPNLTEPPDANIEKGATLGNMWVYQGFIEDKFGALRPQTYEETMYCIGCHSKLGATTDSTFAFGRKLDEYQNGWYHWSQKGFVGLSEPKLKNGKFEYSNYLKLNGAGDEFRENEEVIAKFFNKDGSLKTNMINALHIDISTLILPSQARALELNKAYLSIVQEQSFILGRDATIKPTKNVYKDINSSEQKTGIKTEGR